MAINLGSTPIIGIYIGSTPISRTYVGSTLVYQADSIGDSLIREPDGTVTVVSLAPPTIITLTREANGDATVGAA